MSKYQVTRDEVAALKAHAKSLEGRGGEWITHTYTDARYRGLIQVCKGLHPHADGIGALQSMTNIAEWHVARGCPTPF